MELKEILMQTPTFMLIATAFDFVKAAITGVDVKPLISKTMDEAVPAIV